MTTKKDQPGKDEAWSKDTAGSKKPYATLDLKATEITVQIAIAIAQASSVAAGARGRKSA